MPLHHSHGWLQRFECGPFDVFAQGKSTEAALSSKGQATIPRAVREFLHLMPGGKLKFSSTLMIHALPGQAGSHIMSMSNFA